MESSESKPAINSHLNLFTLGPSDISLTNSLFIPVYPTTGITEPAAPLEFQILGIPNTYINLAESYLYLRLKVLKGDGSVLDDNTDISTSNFLANSLFDLLEIYIHGKLISSKNYYNYCAYLLAHLSYGKEYKETQLKSALYFPETNAEIIGTGNNGYEARKKYISKSKEVELISVIYDDIFLQPRWLVPNCNLSFKFKRAPTEFVLLSPSDKETYKISFQEAIFYCKKEIVAPRIVELHEKTLEKTKALYPFTRNEIKVISIPSNSINSVTENIFSSNKLPQRLVICLVAAENMSGKLSGNPYLFSHFDVSNLTLSVDNVALEYRTLDIAFKTQYLRAFHSLISGLNLDQKSINIDRDSYLDGSCIYSFLLQGYDGSPSFYTRTGSLKLEISFKKALEKPLFGIIFSQTQSILTIDRYRNAEIENQGVL